MIEQLHEMNLTCVEKRQVLDTCSDPECRIKHTKGTIFEVTLTKIEGEDCHTRNHAVLSCFSEDGSIPFEIGRTYTVTIASQSGHRGT